MGFKMPPKDVPPFEWSPNKDDVYTNECLDWLRQNITIPDNVELYCASREHNFLSTTIASTQFNITGTLGVVIADKVYINDNNTPSGVRVGLELKRKVGANDYMQAIVELVTVSIASKYSVAIVLTDLSFHWQFFWLVRSSVMSCKLDPSQAVTLLEVLARDSESAAVAPGQSMVLDTPYRERCTIRDIFKGEERSCMEETTVDGLELLLERPKLDVMEMLPKEDVADMRDVFDTMSAKEIRDWQTKEALGFVMQTPAIQSSITGDEWQTMYQ